MTAPLWLGFSLVNFLEAAAVGAVIIVSRLWARRHPKIPPER